MRSRQDRPVVVLPCQSEHRLMHPAPLASHLHGVGRGCPNPARPLLYPSPPPSLWVKRMPHVGHHPTHTPHVCRHSRMHHRHNNNTLQPPHRRDSPVRHPHPSAKPRPTCLTPHSFTQPHTHAHTPNHTPVLQNTHSHTPTCPLQAARTPNLCCLAIPADMSVAEFCTFCGAFLPIMRSLRVLRREARQRVVCMVLCRFASQEDADDFYHNLNGKPVRLMGLVKTVQRSCGRQHNHVQTCGGDFCCGV